MNRLVTKFCVSLALVALGVAETWAAAANPQIVEFCEVSKAPQQFEGKRISIYAKFQSNGIDLTTLHDPKSNCDPVDFGVTPKAGKSQTWRELQLVLYQIGVPGTLGKEVQALFSGSVLHAAPPHRPFAVFTADQIQNLYIRIGEPKAAQQGTPADPPSAVR